VDIFYLKFRRVFNFGFAAFLFFSLLSG
jgi:hypothetical protein